MGRSQLQGTPWHYEYTKGNGVNNSKNCAFNTGERCACRISPNHNRTCVGKSNCDEFERSSFRKTNNKTENKFVINKSKAKTQNHEKNNVKHSSVRIVQLGDTVVVNSLVTDEVIEIKISDRKNPFYSRALNEVVLIKGEKYQIIKISNP